MIRRLVPIVRRCTQLLGVLLLFLFPLLALLTHYKEAHAIHGVGADDLATRGRARHRTGRGQRRTTSAIRRPVARDDLVGTRGGREPVRSAGGRGPILSSRSFYRPLLASLLIPVLLTVLLGRVFCGWFCPMNTLLEAVDKARRGCCGWSSCANMTCVSRCGTST